MTTSSGNDDVELHVELAGEGTPVVMTHGWLNSGDDWSGVVEGLRGSVRSASWDLRGHGRSGEAGRGNYGRDALLDDLDRVVTLAGGPPAVLVGHSLGGYLSLAYAITRPERVSGLVLVASGPGFRSDDSREQWNTAVLEMAKKVDIPDGQEETTVHVDAMVIDGLPGIGVPVVTVVGANDRRFLASADVFDRYLDVRERVVVPDAGHLVHVKHPEAVVAAINTVVAAAF